MDTARIADLLSPFLEVSLSQPQLNHISMYIDLLQRWNARINLTAIRNEEEIVTRHFGESLFLARHLFPSTSTPRHPERSVLDIGSGAGFPGVPIKIWAPGIHLTLIESNHKKTVFLREVARALILTDINVITGRAETLAAQVGKDFPRADVVTLRAVERFEKILPQTVTFMAPQTRLALLIGAAQLPELTKLTPLKWDPPIPIPKSNSRMLSIGLLR
jgi:16S rRNA (guanine527-N7)-methyltransferase